jgi:plastocyanin
MKKLLFLALAIFLIGCSAQVDQDATPEMPEEDELPVPPPIEDAGDEEDLGDESEMDSGDSANTRQIVVEGGNFYFEPNEIRVVTGETVEFVFENVEGTHDFVIPELGVGTEVIQGGESESFTYTFDEPGTFDFECSVGSHAAQGMVGSIIVS